MKSRNAQGFTLIELLIVIAIIGILTAIAIPQFNAYKVRSYDVNAKSGLKQFFMACKSYWIDQGSQSDCTLAIATNPTYGFVPQSDIIIVPSGNENNFSATGQHTMGSRVFTLGSSGLIN